MTSFLQHQIRSATVRDESIYPNLCKSQVSQLDIMLHQCEQIIDIHRRCIKARDELSYNIKERLRWIYHVEQNVNALDSHLLLWIDNMKKMDNQLSIYEQVHTCPQLYFNAVAEVIRRQNFCQNFSGVSKSRILSLLSTVPIYAADRVAKLRLTHLSLHIVSETKNIEWAFQLSTENRCIWDEEVTIRESFMELISSHFLKDLFPGLNDIPPAFAIYSPETFDQRLPKLTPDNIQLLRELVPEICSQFSFNKLDGIPPILRHIGSQHPNKESENISHDEKFKYSTELFASAVGSTTAHKATSTELKCDPPVSPDHFIVSRPTSLIRDHPESETDTEEFEKVCGSISDGTYSPMEPERNVPLSKLKSRSSQETNPSPLSDRLQSPPSQLLHEFVTVQCRIPEEGDPMSNLMFEDFTHNDLIEALQSEARHLKKENLSQESLNTIVSRLVFIISKLSDVKLESLSTSTLKETRVEIELKNNLLNDAHREIEFYQNEIKTLRVNIEQIAIDFDEERRLLKTEHNDIIRQLSLEHELEIEGIQHEVKERSDELGILKNKLSEIELSLHNTELEKHTLCTKIEEMDSVYKEREKEAIIKEQRKLLEENIRDKQSSLNDLRVQLEREFFENMEKQKQEMENEYKKELLKCSQLWEAQAELLVIQKTKEQKDELTSKHESELENAKLLHKMEIESLRSRFRMMTMDRSPSETSLEKVERGDFIESSVHELALMKIREELNKEKEVALDELRKYLEQSNKATLKNEMQKLEESRKKLEAEKQEEFNSVVKSVTLDKERVIENLRLKVEFLTEENEKHLKHSSPSKLSEDQEHQQHSCEFHKKEIERLEKELHRLRRLSFISERHADVSLSFSETGTAQVSSSSLEQPSVSAASYTEGIKRLQQENSELNQALLRYRAERPPKISMFSCQPYDFILMVWDELYSHYRVLLEGQSSLHFVHSDSYELLGLSKENPNKLFCLAEVVRKEFCQAKKDENRFGVPKGTKFYRVTCRPSKALTPLAEIERAESRQRKSSVLGSPPGLIAISTISLPSKPSEGEFSVPSTDAEVGFSAPSDTASDQKPESTSGTPEKSLRDSTQDST